MATRIEPLPGERKVFRSHHGIDSRWITASTDHERVASVLSSDHRVGADHWDEWLASHPGCVVASWYGVNDQFWSLESSQDGTIETVKVTPRHQHPPWAHQIPETPLKSLPQWAIEALIELGEITTPEIEEEGAVKTIAEGHKWMKPLGMAFDICVRPVTERYSKEVA